jgi:hypothetical protein
LVTVTLPEPPRTQKARTRRADFTFTLNQFSAARKSAGGLAQSKRFASL